MTDEFQVRQNGSVFEVRCHRCGTRWRNDEGEWLAKLRDQLCSTLRITGTPHKEPLGINGSSILARGFFIAFHTKRRQPREFRAASHRCSPENALSPGADTQLLHRCEAVMPSMRNVLAVAHSDHRKFIVERVSLALSYPSRGPSTQRRTPGAMSSVEHCDQHPLALGNAPQSGDTTGGPHRPSLCHARHHCYSRPARCGAFFFGLHDSYGRV
jgi:hypothetical protein